VHSRPADRKMHLHYASARPQLAPFHQCYAMKNHTNKTPNSRHVLAFMTVGLATASAIYPDVARAEDSAVVLDQVNVTGTVAPAYKTEAVSMGPLGEKAWVDAPYSVTTVPAELLANQQIQSVQDAFRYLPSVQGYNIRPQTRGMQAGVVQNTRMDGMNIASTTDYPIEQFDRIEVLNGLAGALYGPANPAGTFNYVLKRPTDEPMQHVSVGYGSQNEAFGTADLSGYIGDTKRFGYRVNLVDQGGEGYVDGSELKRKLASLAFDVRLTDDTTLETNASRYRYIDMGFPGTFALANNNVRFPSAPNPTTVGYGQPYGGDDNVTDTYSARLKHNFNQDWQLTAGLLQQSSDRASTVPTNTLTNNAGAYTTTAATTTFSLDTILSNTIALNGRVNAGGITHDLVFSNTGFEWNRYTPYQTGAIKLGTANLNNPLIFAEPDFPDFESRYKAMTTRQQSFTMGDTIGFNEKWSTSLFASQSRIDVSNYNSMGGVTSRYEASGLSTNGTLSYKPQKNMTIYGSYADSLQQGDIAPAGTANVGAGLAPYRSRQWELGYKVEFSRVNFSAALFRITRPYAETNSDNVFETVGNQVNKGIELMASGAVTSNLTIFGGVTYLDPKVFNTGSSSTSDQPILGLSHLVTSLLCDYRIAAVPGLAVNLFLNHATSRPGNNTDTYQVDGYTTADLGARYTTKLMGRSVTWRMAVNNVTNQTYWANITPSGQNGYTGAGNGTGTLGAPRTVRASLELDF